MNVDLQRAQTNKTYRLGRAIRIAGIGISYIGLIVSSCLLVIGYTRDEYYDSPWPESAWLSTQLSHGGITLFFLWLGTPVEHVALPTSRRGSGTVMSVNQIRSELKRLSDELIEIQAKMLTAAKTHDPYDDQDLEVDRKENYFSCRSSTRHLAAIRRILTARATSVARHRS